MFSALEITTGYINTLTEDVFLKIKDGYVLNTYLTGSLPGGVTLKPSSECNGT